MNSLTPFPYCPLYGVTDDGRIQRISSGQWKIPSVGTRGGYLLIRLYSEGKGKTWPVHQIVAITFHGPRPSKTHHAAHFDGNKNNNHRDNIRWATKQENEADKVRHGTTNRGERNGSAKLADSDIQGIIQWWESGAKQSQIAALYCVDQSHISNIVRGKRRGNSNEPAHS